MQSRRKKRENKCSKWFVLHNDQATTKCMEYIRFNMYSCTRNGTDWYQRTYSIFIHAVSSVLYNRIVMYLSRVSRPPTYSLLLLYYLLYSWEAKMKLMTLERKLVSNAIWSNWNGSLPSFDRNNGHGHACFIVFIYCKTFCLVYMKWSKMEPSSLLFR